jgi:hypothetical protein
MEEKQTIGWKEWVSLPELGITAIKAKIDTGARTSSLHTYHLEKFKKQGKDFVRFDIHPLQKRSDISVTCESEIIDIRSVKDSGGHEEERIFIQTSVQLNNIKWDIEISLTNRENMLFRMLLGRTGLISGNLLVDSSIDYAASKDISDLYK